MADQHPTRLTAREGRRFGLTVGAAFLALGGLVWWRGNESVAVVFAVPGIALMVAGIVLPGQLSGVHRAWMGLAHLLSRVTTPIFMGLVYFVVISPVGALMRLAGRNPLVHRTNGDSYFVVRAEGTRRRRDMERQF